MRKQDRIAAEQQSRASQHTDEQSQPQAKQREQMKGSDSSEQRAKPQRQPGKLPLPD
jgi:hypothetical protein